MFEQNGNARRLAAGLLESAAPATVGRVGASAAANVAYRAGTDESSAALQDASHIHRYAPSAWMLVPRNKAYVETCTFYSQREALAHAEDFDCELVPLFEQPETPVPLHRVIAVLRDCVDALAPLTGPDSDELRTRREAAYRAAAALLQEVDHG